MIAFDLEVDACGLNCPLPLLRLKKALIEMSSGEIVRVMATDPAAHLDCLVVPKTDQYAAFEMWADVLEVVERKQ